MNRATAAQIAAHQVTIDTIDGVTRIRCTGCAEEIGDSSMWAHVDGDATPVVEQIIDAHRIMSEEAGA